MPDRCPLTPLTPNWLPARATPSAFVCGCNRDERITIITDEATREIAAALQAEVEEVGARARVFVLEHHAARPLN